MVEKAIHPLPKRLPPVLEGALTCKDILGRLLWGWGSGLGLTVCYSFWTARKDYNSTCFCFHHNWREEASYLTPSKKKLGNNRFKKKITLQIFSFVGVGCEGRIIQDCAQGLFLALTVQCWRVNLYWHCALLCTLLSRPFIKCYFIFHLLLKYTLNSHFERPVRPEL